MTLTLFFDLEGPLLDASARYHAVHRDLLRAAGLRWLSAERYWTRKRARVPEEEILDELNADARAVDYLRLRRERLEAPNYLLLDRPWPYAHETLARLAARHPLVLVTARANRALLLEQLDRLDLMAFFDEILAESSGPRIDQQKARQIGNYLEGHERAPEGWMIGDTESDVFAGRRAGLQTAAVLTGIRNKELLRMAEPDRLLRDIRELPLLLEPAACAEEAGEGGVP